MLGISRLHGSAATDPICVAFSSKVLRGRIESEEGVMLVVVFRDEVLRHRNRLKNPNAQSWLFTWGFTVSVLLLSNNLIFFFFFFFSCAPFSSVLMGLDMSQSSPLNVEAWVRCLQRGVCSHRGCSAGSRAGVCPSLAVPWHPGDCPAACSVPGGG